ncbi:odorant receptor Or2-like [Sabethes cyaneus]|uniref:odorant receptor Or2-like n=1 Tax=Sabethes cyaneus TaxID=53552 RepID=UPI00237D7D1B|nr:odorant receptor Or2-like [Sabethes cyaneus]
MNILECPIISIDVRICRFWSYLLKHDFMRYVGTIPAGLLVLFMFADLCHSENNFEEVIINAFFAIILFNTLAIEDEAVRSVLSSLTQRARVLCYSNYALGHFVAACISAYPLFTSSRRMLFSLYIPGLDVLESPQYEIICIMQALWLIPACGMYFPFTNFFMSATLFGVIQIKTLQHQLATLKTTFIGEHTDSLNCIVNKYIEDHLRIKDYVYEFNSLVTYVCFFEFVSYGIFMCALLFLLIMTKNPTRLLFIVPYLVAVVLQVFAFYWHANEVSEQSLGIAKAAYNGPWTDVNDSVKKKLLLISLSAQRPLKITLGNVFPMTLEMFQSLLKTSYSYCTILRRFNR